MKNIFRAFGAQNSNDEQSASIELNEQELEQVTGAGGGRDCYDDDDYCDYDHDDYCHRHHHYRHHRHHC